MSSEFKKQIADELSRILELTIEEQPEALDKLRVRLEHELNASEQDS